MAPQNVSLSKALLMRKGDEDDEERWELWQFWHPSKIEINIICPFVSESVIRNLLPLGKLPNSRYVQVESRPPEISEHYGVSRD